VSTTSGDFTFVPEHPQTTTMYGIGGPSQPYTSSQTVVIDPQSRSCGGGLSIAGPALADPMQPTALTGQSSDTGTVTILFRKRGQTQFIARRRLQTDSSGRYATSFRPDDDYRYYAATARCDSPAGLTTIQPTVAGPTRVPRGSSVVAKVRSVANVSVAVYFRAAGSSSITLRRTSHTDGVGVYRFSFVADRDYSYYAVTGPGALRTTAQATTHAV
jgi:hypothetical protein